MTGKVVPIRNLYLIFAYAWEQSEFAWRVDAGEEVGPEAAPFFARVLVRGCHQLFRRGLDRAYRPSDSITTRVRGRILIPQTLSRNSLSKGQVHCEFDELDHNVIHNQLLKATLSLLLKRGELPAQSRADVRQIVRVFDAAGVGDIRPTHTAFRQVQLHRNNAFYSFLVHVCELIHDELFPTQEAGERKFSAILRDETRMADLFERFVRNFFKAEQREFSVQAESIKWDAADIDDTSRALLPSMRTDISLRSSDRTIVVDTKYYVDALQTHFEKRSARSAHLYQIFSYLKNLEVRGGPDATAEGVLLYPTVDDEINFRAVLQGHVVRLRTVDLSRSWLDIRERLLSIVGADSQSAAAA